MSSGWDNLLQPVDGISLGYLLPELPEPKSYGLFSLEHMNLMELFPVDDFVSRANNFELFLSFLS